MKRFNLTLLSFIFVIHTLSANNGSSNFHSVVAAKGDGIFSMLRKYHLKEHKCNIEKFYELNNLNADQMLISGKKYLLPVYIYPFNGVSIRSSLGINNWEKAVRIKEFNENLVNKNLKNQLYTENNILWVPHHELFCEELLSLKESETVESGAPKKTIHENSLFGDKYSNVEVVDQSLKDHVYYIVSGHGGPDPGARCTECSVTLCEDEYAYDVSLRLARDLTQHGAKVEIIVQDRNDGIRDEKYLKCDYDEIYNGNIKIQRRQKTRLRDRAAIVNKLYKKYKKEGFKTQRAIMIHVDSRSSSKRQDVFFYYCKDSKTSKQLAHNIKNTFQEKYDKHQKGRGYKGFIKDRGLYMLNNTLPPAVYIELANIRNPTDHKRLLINTNRQALANWIFEGLIRT